MSPQGKLFASEVSIGHWKASGPGAAQWRSKLWHESNPYTQPPDGQAPFFAIVCQLQNFIFNI